MLKADVIEGTNVVSVEVDGSISADEEVAAQDTIEKVVADHGAVRMLLDFAGVDAGRVEPKAVWEDLKGTRLLNDIERVGVLADSSLLGRFLDVIGGASGIEAKTFDNRDDAVAWLTS